jgi:hypothetical protein
MNKYIKTFESFIMENLSISDLLNAKTISTDYTIGLDRNGLPGKKLHSETQYQTLSKSDDFDKMLLCDNIDFYIDKIEQVNINSNNIKLTEKRLQQISIDAKQHTEFYGDPCALCSSGKFSDTYNYKIFGKQQCPKCLNIPQNS